MKELKILYLYPDLLELYGDYGNIQILRYRLEQRGIKAIIDSYSIGNTPPPDFKSYDIIFSGGGADQEQAILAQDLIQYKDSIQEAIEDRCLFLINLWFFSIIWQIL